MTRLLRLLAQWIQWRAELTSRKQQSGSMAAAAFVRFEGANDLGHVGWGFDVSSGETNVGAVENPRGAATCDAKDMDYWNSILVDPMPPVRERGYNDLKFVSVADADPIEAHGTAKWIATQAYCVISRNCLDDVYDALRSYGIADLPLPAIDLLPNVWFEQFNGEAAHVSEYSWPRVARAPISDNLHLLARAVTPPRPPTWRSPGHPDWRDFQAKLAQQRPSDSYAAQHRAT